MCVSFKHYPAADWFLLPHVLPFPLCHVFLRMSLVCVSLLMRQIHSNKVFFSKQTSTFTMWWIKGGWKLSPFWLRSQSFSLSASFWYFPTFASDCCREIVLRSHNVPSNFAGQYLSLTQLFLHKCFCGNYVLGWGFTQLSVIIHCIEWGYHLILFPGGKKKEGTNSRFLNDTLLYDSTASLLFFNNAKMHFKLDVFKGLIFVFRWLVHL